MIVGFGGDVSNIASGKGRYSLYSIPYQELEGYIESAGAKMHNNQLILTGSAWKPHDLGTIKWNWISVSALTGGIDSKGEPVLILGAPHTSGDETPDYVFAKAMHAMNPISAAPPGTFAQAHIMLPLGNYFFAKVSTVNVRLI